MAIVFGPTTIFHTMYYKGDGIYASIAPPYFSKVHRDEYMKMLHFEFRTTDGTGTRLMVPIFTGRPLKPMASVVPQKLNINSARRWNYFNFHHLVHYFINTFHSHFI
jgi:hypothetical protein